MGEYSKVSSSTEWRSGENVVLRLMECLRPAVSFDTFLAISNLFVCLTALELTTVHRNQKSSITLTVVSKNDSRAVYVGSSESCEHKRCSLCWNVYSRTTIKSVPQLQPEHAFFQEN